MQPWSADSLASFVSVRLAYAGCHGLEVEGPDLSFVHPVARARRHLPDRVAQELAEHLVSIGGARVRSFRLL